MKYNTNYLLKKGIKDSNENEITNETICDFLSKASESEMTKILTATSEIRLKIGEALKTDNIIFLMANGCSIYAGSKSTLCGYSGTVDEKYSLIKDDLANALNGDIETCLNSLHVLKEYYSLTGRQVELNMINEIIKESKEKMLHNYICGIDYSKLIFHEMFLLKLRSFGILRKTSIFTPNYDLSFEYCLDKLGEEYNNGFTGFVNRRFNIASYTNFKPNIVKIHGSLNWKYDELSKDIKEYQPTFKNNIIDIQETGDSIIYPTNDKIFQTYNAPYGELLRFMLNKLQNNKNVIFVLGYKYGDEHINDILLKALSNPLNIYFFFDYDENEDNSFLKYIREIEKSVQSINIISGKCLADFSNFVKYLLPSNPAKTDEEILTEILKKVIK